MSGGAEFSLIEAINGLRDRGCENIVVVPSAGDLPNFLRQMGIETIEIPYNWWIDNRISSLLKVRRLIYHLRLAAGEFASLIHRMGAEVVITNTLAIPIGAMGALFARRPHIWYVRELFGADGHDKYFDYGNRFSLFLMNHLSQRIITNSDAVLRQLARAIPKAKLRSIYNAVEIPDVEPVRSTYNLPIRLGICGLLSPGKRQEEAIYALALLRARGITAHITMIGGQIDNYENHLRAIADELRIADQIEFTGFISNPFTYIACVDAVLMCSRGEAFGRVTVEAMKLGKPVIGAASGGTIELIRDGWNGFLYQLGDPGDLAAKIELLHNDRARLQQMGENARSWANQTFNRERYSSELIRVITEVVGANTG